MNKIEHLVFDLGQVLIAYDMEAPYRRLVPDAAERQRFFDEVGIHEWNLEQDRGRTWADAETELTARYPHHGELIRAFRSNWWEMIPGSIDTNIAIVDDLIDRGLDVTALTNWAPDTFAEAREKFPVLNRFRGVTVSGLVKLLKPEPAIYHHHAATFGLKPEATLFFDDNAKNVEGARAVGWNAEVYTSTDTLVADLRRYGVAP
ncbi:MAG TPA: HAD family phosphatase [Bauldia sp.]|nr:HAD family phosphatase [Bauldia sp.]